MQIYFIKYVLLRTISALNFTCIKVRLTSWPSKFMIFGVNMSWTIILPMSYTILRKTSLCMPINFISPP